MCYVDKDRFDDHVDIVMGMAANCAMTDYLLCQDNQVSTCKLIDCFYNELNDPNSEFLTEDPKTKTYLFSACIPRTFLPVDVLTVCSIVAQGNDFVDYYQN